MKLKKGPNNKYGYVDNKTDEWIIQPRYCNATEFNLAGIAIVTLGKGRQILINKENKNVTGKIYRNVSITKFDYIKAEEIDSNNPAAKGDTIFLKPTGDEIKELRNMFIIEVTNEGVVELTYKDKYGVYSLVTGKFIKPKYERIFNFRDSKNAIPYAVVYKDHKAGLIDWDDNIVIPFDYQDIIPCVEFGVAIVKKNDLIGVVDFEGKEVYPFEYCSYGIVDNKICLNKIVTTYIELKE